MSRIARRIAGIGASDLPDAAAFDAYVGPAREITVDPMRGIIALHDGGTPGGVQITPIEEGAYATAAQGALAVSAVQPESVMLVPAGGITGQFLVKNSNSDYDTVWTEGTGGEGGESEAPNRIFNNRAEAEALSPVTPPRTIETLGYHSRGDGGRAMYAKVDAEPAHAGKLMITLQNGSVSWYEVIL